jgi:hypothetical protein
MAIVLEHDQTVTHFLMNKEQTEAWNRKEDFHHIVNTCYKAGCTIIVSGDTLLPVGDIVVTDSEITLHVL